MRAGTLQAGDQNAVVALFLSAPRLNGFKHAASNAFSAVLFVRNNIFNE